MNIFSIYAEDEYILCSCWEWIYSLSMLRMNVFSILLRMIVFSIHAENEYILYLCWGWIYSLFMLRMNISYIYAEEDEDILY